MAVELAAGISRSTPRRISRCCSSGRSTPLCTSASARAGPTRLVTTRPRSVAGDLLVERQAVGHLHHGLVGDAELHGALSIWLPCCRPTTCGPPGPAPRAAGGHHQGTGHQLTGVDRHLARGTSARARTVVAPGTPSGCHRHHRRSLSSIGHRRARPSSNTPQFLVDARQDAVGVNRLDLGDQAEPGGRCTRHRNIARHVDLAVDTQFCSRQPAGATTARSSTCEQHLAGLHIGTPSSHYRRRGQLGPVAGAAGADCVPSSAAVAVAALATGCAAAGAGWAACTAVVSPRVYSIWPRRGRHQVEPRLRTSTSPGSCS